MRPLAVLELERRTLLSTFTVTDTLDDTNKGSLRWAIGQVNSDNNPAADTIKFAIPGSGVQVIAPTSPLPSITHAVLIDGFSQSSSTGPLIELSGSQAGGGDGLVVTTSGVTIRGLDINGFSQGAGIHLTGTGATGDWVYGNFLGVDPTGTQALPNDFGVEIDAGASTNLVGTNGDGVNDAAERNLISGNLFAGVWINGSGTNANVVAGNFIGTDVTGAVAIDNGTQSVYDPSVNATFGGGVVIENGASNNRVGTDGLSVDDAGQRNVIAGSPNDGVDIAYGGSDGNIVAGNFIGTDHTGTLALGIVGDGVFIAAGADSNWVGVNPNGGVAADQGNLISGAGYDGVQIYDNADSNVVAGNKLGTDVTGTLSVSNYQGVEIDSGTGNTVGGTSAATRDIISGNRWDGVHIVGGGNNVVEGDYIGVDASGSSPLGNPASGIAIIGGSSGNTIGGATAGSDNVISANGYGIFMSDSGTTGNLVEGNDIGTDRTGSLGLGNANIGVEIRGSTTNDTIGGTTAGARNIISANGTYGVFLTDFGTTGIVVQGNLIGTDGTGTVGLGNGYDGVYLDYDASGNTIGGDTPGAGNVISANGGNGIALYNGGNPILANLIGVDAAGTAPLGNRYDGIYVPSYNSTIGGTNAAAANIIGGNGGYGVDISFSSSALVQGNFIGTDATGRLNLGNAQGGVEITEFSSNNSIGGLGAGQANTIAFNGGNGVTVGSSSCLGCGDVGNGILSNWIYSNGALGIDLGDDGVTLNTPGGPHIGPNDFQNFPVLNHVVTFNGSTYIIGTFNSAPNSSFTLQFFLNPKADPSGYGQGQTLVDTTTVNTDGGGNASFFLSLPTALPAGEVISATATDSSNNTSEFSHDATIVASNTAALAFNDTYNTDENTTLNVPAPGVLGNDIDLLGNPLSAVLVTSTSHGTLGLQSNGSFTYTPNANFLGADTFTYYATDGTYKSSDATVTINVNPKTYVVTNTNDSGVGSLRWAITQANLSNTAPPDTINFKIPGTGPFTIQPLTPLPAITHPTVINGYTQPGSAANTLAQGDNARIQIDLDGSVAGGDGLAISAGGSTVKGLAITDFTNGIHVTSNGGDAITGDFLGTSTSGELALANQTGILIDAAGGNTIGGTGFSARNLISGNSQQGVLIDDGSSGNSILGNLIGTDATGESRLGNGTGAVLTDSPQDTVGGTARYAGNVISANGYDGILLNSAQGFGAGSSGAVIQGNFIGTDATGTVALGNGFNGIDLEAASNASIGGTTFRARNIISGNLNGIYDFGPSALIQGNFIGTDVTGTKPVGNSADGISMGPLETGITIGGSTSGSGNVISANSVYGVADFFGNDNLIQGNFIGTDVTGTQPLGNGSDGLNIGAFSDTIGGTSSKASNVISANGGDGVDIVSNNTLVVGNDIGTDVTGTKALGNAQDGVAIGVSFSAGNNDSIGGTAPGAANIIAFNRGNGVTVGSTTSFGPSVSNAILSNSIYSNGKLGIDLNDDGVTLNTPGGPHTGPNDFQNFPVLYASITYKGMTYVKGTLNSTPNTVFTVQFFANVAADPSGYGQGQFYIGQGTVVTDVSGNANFQFSFKGAIPTATALSATATDPNNNTSEFAADVPIVANAGPLYAGNDQYHIDFDTSLVILAPGVQTNDLAINGQPFSTVLVTGPADGSLTLNADGSLSYTPNSGFIGVDHFTYKDVQGSTVSNVATVTIDVNPKTYVVTNTNDSGPGSLRQAILGANLATSPAPDTIDFDIPGTGPFTISPLTPLPELTHPTIVDGYSQPGSRPNNKANGDNAVILIQLDGSQVQSSHTTDGLAIGGGLSTVDGLSITGFGNGIHLLGSGVDLVTGNFIGLNPGGAAAGNSNAGVFIDGVPANTIGGSSASARNVISANVAAGIAVSNSSSDQVMGDFVGTDVTGTQARGNGQSFSGAGISFVNSPYATVGGSTSGAGNLVSGNNNIGVYLDPTSDYAVIQGNRIGTDVTGTVAVGNVSSGIDLTGNNFTIGGTTAAARNVISGNQASGIVLFDQFLNPGTSNVVEGNYIGVDSSGAKPLGNAGDGIDLTFMGNLTIGGATAKAANVISSNGGYGINMFSEEGPQVIEANDIGTDRTGTIALGNHYDGLYIDDGLGVTIGGTAPVARNIISANGGSGVHFYSVFGGSNSGDVVQGNSIGTNANGTVALGNTQDGVLIDIFTTGILIGGTVAGAGNIIADNTGTGVAVLNYPFGGFDSNDNGILSNSIFGNGALGIDLGGDGVTPNHPGGPIPGPNEFQNYPVLTSAASANGKITIAGTLNSAANTTYLIQFFANPTADPSGHGQGKTLIGSITVTTDGNGNASFTATFSVKVAVGQFISSTATDPNNNTSEFSQDVTVTASAATATATPAAVSLAIAPLPSTATVVTAVSTGAARVNRARASSPSLSSEDVLEAVAQELVLSQRRKRLAFVASDSPWQSGGSV
jgi:hypothetical protein